MKIVSELITLTADGQEALDVVKSLFPDSSEDEHLSILIGMAAEDAELDYIIAERDATDVLVSCHCIACNKNMFMGLGWIGHRDWIKNKLCALCNLTKRK